MSELRNLYFLFMGLAIGSFNPLGIWGFIVFISLSTLFFIIDLFKLGNKNNG